MTYKKSHFISKGIISSVLISSLVFGNAAKADAYIDGEKSSELFTIKLPEISSKFKVAATTIEEDGFIMIILDDSLDREEEPTYPIPTPQTPKLSVDKYHDYDSNAYWAQEMKWAIDQGLITGYQNQKHPTTPSKGIGNWINPYGNLTEYQMLNTLLRYKDSENYEATKLSMKDKTISNYSYVEYYLAKKLGITTSGTLTNVTSASRQVRRGEMAQAIVSMHFGKEVSVEHAVQFMYDNELSTGISPEKGLLFSNFGVDKKLTRAQLVTFLSRYNDLQESGKIIENSFLIINIQTKGSFNWNSMDLTLKGEVGETYHIKPKMHTFSNEGSNMYACYSCGQKIKGAFPNDTYTVTAQSEYANVTLSSETITLNNNTVYLNITLEPKWTP